MHPNPAAGQGLPPGESVWERIDRCDLALFSAAPQDPRVTDLVTRRSAAAHAMRKFMSGRAGIDEAVAFSAFDLTYAAVTGLGGDNYQFYSVVPERVRDVLGSQSPEAQRLAALEKVSRGR